MCDPILEDELNEILGFLDTPARAVEVKIQSEPFLSPRNISKNESARNSTVQPFQSATKPTSIQEISKRIGEVDSLVCQIRKTEGERDELRKQLQEIQKSVKEVKGLYENEKQKHLNEKAKYEELFRNYQRLDSDLASKKFVVDQLQAQCDGLKFPIEYNDLAVRFLKYVQKHEDDNFHWHDQLIIKEIQKYCNDKGLKIPPILPKAPRKRKSTVPKCNKEVQCVIEELNSQIAGERKEMLNQSTQCGKVSTRNQASQHIGTTTTRSTTTSCFIKYHDVGVGCNILDINYVLNKMLDDVCSWSKPVAPLSPINDLDTSQLLTPPLPTVASLPPPSPPVKIKTIGTCTDICNVQRPVDYESNLPIIKRSDSRPPSTTTMYESIKNENTARFSGTTLPSIDPSTNRNPPTSIPNMFPNAFDELWQIFGHMIYGLLHRGVGSGTSFCNQKIALGNITCQQDFYNWFQSLYNDTTSTENVQTQRTLPTQRDTNDINFTANNNRQEISVENRNLQTQNCNVGSPLNFSNAVPVKDTLSEQYLFKPTAQRSGNLAMDAETIPESKEHHRVVKSPHFLINSTKNNSNESSDKMNSDGNSEHSSKNRTPSAFTSPKSSNKDNPRLQNPDQLSATAEEILQLFPSVNNPTLALQSLQNLLHKNLNFSDNITPKKPKKDQNSKEEKMLPIENGTAVEFIANLPTFIEKNSDQVNKKDSESQVNLESSHKNNKKTLLRKRSKRIKLNDQMQKLFGSESDDSDSNEPLCPVETITEDITKTPNPLPENLTNLERFNEKVKNFELSELSSENSCNNLLDLNSKIENKYVNCTNEEKLLALPVIKSDSSSKTFNELTDILEESLQSSKSSTTTTETESDWTAHEDSCSRSSDFEEITKHNEISGTEINCLVTEKDNDIRQRYFNLFGSDSDATHSGDEDSEVSVGKEGKAKALTSLNNQIGSIKCSEQDGTSNDSGLMKFQILQRYSGEIHEVNCENITCLENGSGSELIQETLNTVNKSINIEKIASNSENDIESSLNKVFDQNSQQSTQYEKQIQADIEKSSGEAEKVSDSLNEMSFLDNIPKSEVTSQISLMKTGFPKPSSSYEHNILQQNMKYTLSSKFVSLENASSLLSSSEESDRLSISSDDSESKLEIINDFDETPIYRLPSSSSTSSPKKRGRKRKNELLSDAPQNNAVETTNSPCKRSARLLAKTKITQEQNIEHHNLKIGKNAKQNTKEINECKMNLRDSLEDKAEVLKNNEIMKPVLGYFQELGAENSKQEEENANFGNQEPFKFPQVNDSSQDENSAMVDDKAASPISEHHSEVPLPVSVDKRPCISLDHVIFESPPASPLLVDNEIIEDQLVKTIPLERPEDSYTKRRRKTLLHNLIYNYREANYRPIHFPQFEEKDTLEITQIMSYFDEYLSLPRPDQSNTVQLIDSVYTKSQNVKVIAHAICSSLKKISRTPTIPYQIQNEQAHLTMMHPVETVIQKIFTHALSELIFRKPILKDTLLSTIESILFSIQTANTLTLDTALNLTDLYLLTLTLHNSTTTTTTTTSTPPTPTTTENPARLFISKCLYFHKIKAVPMIYTVLRSYPTTLPHREEDTYDRSDPLISVIQHILMCSNYDMSSHDLFHRELISALRFAYHFEPFKPDFQTVLQNLFEKLRAGKLNNLKYSFAILCKRLQPDRVIRDIINAHMIPLSNEYYSLLRQTTEYDERAAALLDCLSTVIKPFPLHSVSPTSIAKEIKSYFEIFPRFLFAVERPIVQEAAVLAILRLQRFDNIHCYNALISFRPDYTLQPQTKAALKTFIQRKPRSFWKTLLSKVVY